MSRIVLIPLLVCLLAGTVSSASAAKMRFWNETTVTITELSLSPAGKDQWGPNQCDNDTDKSVDTDERLNLVGVTPGNYDVRVTDAKGRSCVVRNVAVRGDAPYAFGLADKDLVGCK